MSAISRIKSVMKPDEVTIGRFTIFPVLPYVVLMANRLGMSPNAVTVTSFAISTIIGLMASRSGNTYAWPVAVLLQVFIILDCADGTLARFTGRTSRFGALLDQVLDRYSDLAITLGICIGLARDGKGPLVWMGGILFIFGILLNVLMGHVYGQLRTTHVDSGLARSQGRGANRGIARAIQTVLFGGDIRFLALAIGVLTGTTHLVMLGAGLLWTVLLMARLLLLRSKLA